jgi:hypothetical protein
MTTIPLLAQSIGKEICSCIINQLFSKRRSNVVVPLQSGYPQSRHKRHRWKESRTGLTPGKPASACHPPRSAQPASHPRTDIEQHRQLVSEKRVFGAALSNTSTSGCALDPLAILPAALALRRDRRPPNPFCADPGRSHRANRNSLQVQVAALDGHEDATITRHRVTAAPQPRTKLDMTDGGRDGNCQCLRTVKRAARLASRRSLLPTHDHVHRSYARALRHREGMFP